jgi:hypothetical protein
MGKGRNFIDREIFEQIISDVPRQDGLNYEDTDTIYGDMSRLVVAWLARTPPSELRQLYNDLGWLGDANARGMHEAAKKWMQTYRSEGSNKT